MNQPPILLFLSEKRAKGSPISNGMTLTFQIIKIVWNLRKSSPIPWKRKILIPQGIQNESAIILILFPNGYPFPPKNEMSFRSLLFKLNPDGSEWLSGQ